MIGKLYIDGKDAYAEYNLFVTKGGYAQLLAYAPLKTVDSNDWAEDDGVEVDLSNPTLDTRSVNIPFASHNNVKTGEFLELLSDMAYHTFDFRDIGRVFTLRLVSQSSLRVARGLELFTLQFADDSSLTKDYVYKTPVSNQPTTGYELDGIDLCKYGIQILKGSKAEVLKSPAVKKKLTRSLKYQNGAEYDSGEVTYQAKEATLQLLMIADTLDEFWQHYDAFLHDLIKIDEDTHSAEKMMYFSFLDYEYPCYYKSSEASRFYPFDKIWYEFSITLVFTDFRVEGDIDLLATQDMELVIDEYGNYIDLTPYGN